MIGMMTQWGFQDPPEAGVSEDLVAAFPDAEEKYPDSLLAGYDFSYKK